MAAGHGYNRYTHGCRCDICRRAKADYMRQKRATARVRRQAAEADGRGRHFVPAITHGISGYQNSACRCRVCIVAKSSAWLRETRRRLAFAKHEEGAA